MSLDDWERYPRFEQDQEGTARGQSGDDLPTYDDLAAKSGPNSRFGRWRSWIEKRAAERYADITPEDREHRRARGWDLPGEEYQQSLPSIITQPPTPAPAPLHIHVQTEYTNTNPPPISPFFNPSPSPTPLIGQGLAPSHLKLHNFGSRFLPHTTSPIRSLLPLPGDRLLLIGHDDGLSVLDMFPHEWTEEGLSSKGPSEAVARHIWEGEGVYQMSFLEVDSTGDSTPQGVVLALVGHPESDPAKEQEPVRTLRMYNLASLVSLAKWTCSQRTTRPLDLRRSGNPQQQTLRPKKRHSPRSSLTKGLKSLVVDSPGHGSFPSSPASFNSKSALLHNHDKHNNHHHRHHDDTRHDHPEPQRDNSGNFSDSGWDMVDDLPLRWATDYVSLAAPGSRLVNTTVLSYDLWRDENSKGRGSLLAVATKNNILLYQTPRGERAFSFVKEFYTPLHPCSMSFIHQSFQDSVSRSTSDATHVRASSGSSTKSGKHERHSSMVGPFMNYGNQLCLFVLFEKKAGIIRIADASVGEVELYEGSGLRDTSPTTSRRSRMSYDAGGHFGFSKEGKGSWVPPERIEIPMASGSSHHHPLSQGVYCLTRGKQTHLLASPLPVNIPYTAPLQALSWNYQPKYVIPRVCYPPPAGENPQPFLQLVALGDDGVEVQEIPISSLTSGKGKGKASEPVRAYVDLGGDTGFLCMGGQWHRPVYSQLDRSYSTASGFSTTSFDSMSTEEVKGAIRKEQGIYAWVKKGFEDWRIFWVGGTGSMLDETSILEE